MYAMAKLCLRQETELSELRQEKSFLLHVNAGPHGILKPLIQASIKWNELRDQMKVGLQSQVRTLPPDAQGNGGKNGEVRANPGKHCSCGEGQVDCNSASNMALPEVGPGCASSCPRSKSPRRLASGSQGPAGVHEARP